MMLYYEGENIGYLDYFVIIIISNTKNNMQTSTQPWVL